MILHSVGCPSLLHRGRGREGLRRGEAHAAEQVFLRFAQRLIALARSRIDAAVRSKEDPEDVVQSVFRSFFTRQRGGQFLLADWESLWASLTFELP